MPLGRSGPCTNSRRLGRLVLVIWLDRTLQLDGQRFAFAIERLAGRDADPAFADAIFLDVGLLLAGKADADGPLQHSLVVEWAVRVGGKAVGKRIRHDDSLCA